MTHLTRGPVLMRAALIPATLVLFVLVSGFLAQVRWATDLWPWPAKPLSYIFLGAATYFIYGALDPHWGNAVGQLAGFLAYDLVLLAPFFEHFSTAQGGSLVSLIIYVAFLVYSGMLASYYLFASKATRIRLALIGPDSSPALAAGDADLR